MILNYINIFIYQLRHNKLFSLLNILGLSMGIAGVIFALLYWNDEQSYNEWNPEKDKVYQVLVQLSDTPAGSDCALFLKPALDEDPNIKQKHCTSRQSVLCTITSNFYHYRFYCGNITGHLYRQF